jgi:hypothetical protein
MTILLLNAGSSRLKATLRESSDGSENNWDWNWMHTPTPKASRMLMRPSRTPAAEFT